MSSEIKTEANFSRSCNVKWSQNTIWCLESGTKTVHASTNSEIGVGGNDNRLENLQRRHCKQPTCWGGDRQSCIKDWRQVEPHHEFWWDCSRASEIAGFSSISRDLVMSHLPICSGVLWTLWPHCQLQETYVILAPWTGPCEKWCQVRCIHMKCIYISQVYRKKHLDIG
jgi:hypothetical protein